jgi:hypothetical protein
MTKKIDPSYRFCVKCEAKATLFDRMDNAWCEADTPRHDLMNWGFAHDWPRVHCQAAEETVNIRKGHNRYYAVGEGYTLWFTACTIGTDHFMETLGATVLRPSEEA